ncbi:nucleotidyltransferase domain-containing protein, partial [Candidatus Saccharibacteria bacterium]|nr:nucleotidyltransferase domain-containing protein [Candidatus Saccharibacteria bacterium]
MPKPTLTDLETEKVMGIGPSKAKELEAKYGIRTIAQLKKNKAAQEDLNDEALNCLKYCPFKRYRRATVKRGYDQAKALIGPLLPKSAKMDLVGSYRRGKATSGDIDILVTFAKNHLKEWESVVARLNETECKDVKWIIQSGERNSFVLHGKKFDIFLIDKENYWTALLHWTGGHTENIVLRAHAKRLGMKLSQNGLFDKNGKKIPIHSEADVYRALGKE